MYSILAKSNEPAIFMLISMALFILYMIGFIILYAKGKKTCLLLPTLGLALFFFFLNFLSYLTSSILKLIALLLGGAIVIIILYIKKNKATWLWPAVAPICIYFCLAIELIIF